MLRDRIGSRINDEGTLVKYIRADVFLIWELLKEGTGKGLWNSEEIQTYLIKDFWEINSDYQI